VQFAPGAANPIEQPAPGLSVEASSAKSFSLHTLSQCYIVKQCQI